MIFTSSSSPIDMALPCDQRWAQAKNTYPWNGLIIVDGADRVRQMYLSQCCEQKAEALLNIYGPDVVAQFKQACIQSNGTLNDATTWAQGVGGGPEGLLAYLGLDFGGATGRLDANKASITKAVIAVVLVLIAIFFIWKIWK